MGVVKSAMMRGDAGRSRGSGSDRSVLSFGEGFGKGVEGAFCPSCLLTVQFRLIRFVIDIRQKRKLADLINQPRLLLDPLTSKRPHHRHPSRIEYTPQ